MNFRSPVMRQGVLFAVFGGVAAVMHFLMALFVASMGIGPLKANLAGYVCAVAVSYFGNALVTFRTALNHGQFVRFVVVSLASFGLNQLVVYIGVHQLGWPFREALALGVILAAAVSFILSKLWTFRRLKDV